MYELIMDYLMRGRPLPWSRLLSYCLDYDDVQRAVEQCKFYGVVIADKPDIEQIDVKRPSIAVQ
jgi:hypothetical protein